MWNLGSKYRMSAEEDKSPVVTPRAPIEEDEDTAPSESGVSPLPDRKLLSDAASLREPRTLEESSAALDVSTAQVVKEESAPHAAELAVDPRIGMTLNGRYRLDRLVGKGGMGRVYRATQFPLNRSVAVKILNPEFQRKDPQFVRRFFLEAASAARLTHPNTITVFDYGEAETGELFIAMEFLRGRPLSRVIAAESPFPVERTIHVSMQICRALRAAHSKGIIHRDLKPGNILLLEEGDDLDFAKVLDFGLVKLFTPNQITSTSEPLTPGPGDDDPGELTTAGMFLGSPKYMSPEQIQAIALDPRTDIYSLGVLMFLMSTGKPPFAGATSVEVIYKHVNHPVPLMGELIPGLSVHPEFEEIVRKCLEKKRENRFPSMGELLIRLKDLRRMITGISSATDISSVGYATIPPNSGEASFLDPEGSHSVSIRPQTHPTRSSQVTSSLVDEAAFVESVDISGVEPSVAFQRVAKQPFMQRAAPWLAAIAFLLVLGLLAYLLTAPAVPDRPPPPPPAVAATKTKVRFVSQPSGAEVFEDGVSLGRTPLTLPMTPSDTREREFLFKLDGYFAQIEQSVIGGSEMLVRVSLRPRGANSAAGDQTDKKSGEDYKDNPY